MAIRAAAAAGSSCSQTRTTFHFAAASAASTRRSRATLAASFGVQYEAFRFGSVAWIGQRCQKHPSTNTQRETLVKTMSGRTRRSSTKSWRSFRKRRPKPWRALRSLSSGSVSTRRLASMVRRTASFDAHEPERESRAVLWLGDSGTDRSSHRLPGCRRADEPTVSTGCDAH